MQTSNLKAVLYSSLGQQIRSYPVVGINEQIDLSEVPAGLYYLQLISDQRQIYQSQKIIVLAE